MHGALVIAVAWTGFELVFSMFRSHGAISGVGLIRNKFAMPVIGQHQSRSLPIWNKAGSLILIETDRKSLFTRLTQGGST